MLNFDVLLGDASATELASGFAQRWVSMRNQLAPNVVLAYHMSGWGTKHDIVYEDPPDATVRRYAEQSATFYRSLHAHFDIAFEDFSDRDAGFYTKIQGNPNTWFKPADFAREALRSDDMMRKLSNGLYHCLPRPLRRFVPEAAFVGFCMEHRQKLLETAEPIQRFNDSTVQPPPPSPEASPSPNQPPA